MDLVESCEVTSIASSDSVINRVAFTWVTLS